MMLEMIFDGLLEEFEEFLKINKLDISQVPYPLGFKEYLNLKEVIKRQRSEIRYLSESKRQEQLVKQITHFLEQFYGQTRQYSKQQKKYFKVYNQEFIWIDVDQQDPIKVINETLNLDKENLKEYLNSKDQDKLKIIPAIKYKEPAFKPNKILLYKIQKFIEQ
ncbi:hypothetical protein pb186bvf_017244 [Paramecium bursaria]